MDFEVVFGRLLALVCCTDAITAQWLHDLNMEWDVRQVRESSDKSMTPNLAGMCQENSEADDSQTSHVWLNPTQSRASAISKANSCCRFA